jgi:hypothetical protein
VAQPQISGFGMFSISHATDEWSGDFCAHRVVDTLGKMNTKKTQADCIKSGPIIRHFSDPGFNSVVETHKQHTLEGLGYLGLAV